jgi:hypothetical protein
MLKWDFSIGSVIATTARGLSGLGGGSIGGGSVGGASIGGGASGGGVTLPTALMFSFKTHTITNFRYYTKFHKQK